MIGGDSMPANYSIVTPQTVAPNQPAVFLNSPCPCEEMNERIIYLLERIGIIPIPEETSHISMTGGTVTSPGTLTGLRIQGTLSFVGLYFRESSRARAA